MTRRISWSEFLAVILFFCIVPLSLVSASETYYVKEGANGEGSDSDPFGSVADAISEIKEKGGKKIVVDEGSYDADITIPKGVKLVGTETKEVLLGGLVRMEDKTELSKVTVRGKGVVVLANATVSIDNVVVKDVLGIGINVEAGKGTVTVAESRIENARKGMYIQKGNRVSITDIEVISNTEEGLDLRQNISGSIKKSVFRDNGESGIEVILGNADLVIDSNEFEGNGSSGIVAQFFDGATKTGDVRIVNNSIATSGNYGIDCKAPQGGLESKDYYVNSINATGNTFKKNKEGEIAGNCRLLTDEERKALLERRAARLEQTLSPAEFASRVERAVTARKEYDDIRQAEERQGVEEALTRVQELLASAQTLESTTRTRSATMCFLVGDDAVAKRSLRATILDITSLIEHLTARVTRLAFEANQDVVTARLNAYNETLIAMNDTVSTQTCAFSLFGWLNALVADWGQAETLVPREVAEELSLFPSVAKQKVLFVGGIGYIAGNRALLVKQADDTPFSGLKDDFRSYGEVVATLYSPMIDEADPVPAQNTFAPLLLPNRFANVLATHNIRVLHLGQSKLMRSQGEKGYQKTVVNTGLAGITTFGGVGNVSSREIFLGGVPIVLLEYAESVTADPKMALEAIDLAKEGARVVVFIAYDLSLGTILTDERKQVARRFIDAGAEAVIGTGLAMGAESEVIGTKRIYYSLGTFWGMPEQGSLAVSMELPQESGDIVWQEKAVSWDNEGKIILTPKQEEYEK